MVELPGDVAAITVRNTASKLTLDRRELAVRPLPILIRLNGFARPVWPESHEEGNHRYQVNCRDNTSDVDSRMAKPCHKGLAQVERLRPGRLQVCPPPRSPARTPCAPSGCSSRPPSVPAARLNHGDLGRTPDPAHPAGRSRAPGLAGSWRSSDPLRTAPGPMPADGGQPAAAAAAAA